jgi:hypothetical protein
MKKLANNGNYGSNYWVHHPPLPENPPVIEDIWGRKWKYMYDLYDWWAVVIRIEDPYEEQHLYSLPFQYLKPYKHIEMPPKWW